MILLVFATKVEARPFIEYHDLTAHSESDVYELFKGKGISLVVTGMGSLRGALHLSDVLQAKKQQGEQVAEIVNYGVAGCVSEKFSIGDVVEIDKVVKYDPVEFSKPIPDKHFLSSFPDIAINTKGNMTASLATSDHPVFTEEDSRKVARYAHLVDMEGYGYAFTARHYNVPIRLLKGVSDFTWKKSEKAFRDDMKLSLDKLLSFHATHGLGQE
jgi:adenosylhomocysteine nucleosidase